MLPVHVTQLGSESASEPVVAADDHPDLLVCLLLLPVG
ncbi:hypothetical protein ACVWXB_001681 [Streptomyces sp. TE12347]